MDWFGLLSSVKSRNLAGVNKALGSGFKYPGTIIDEFGNNALHLAASLGYPEIVERLLKDGRFDVNAVTNYHETALFMAVRQWANIRASRENYIKIVRLLLKVKGIEPEIQNYDDITEEEDQTAIFKAIPYVTDIDPDTDISMLDLLLNDGRINPRIPSKYDGEPIHHAVLANNLAAIDRLLKDSRVDPTAKCNFGGVLLSPLELAVDGNRREIVLRLLEETRVIKSLNEDIKNRLKLDPTNIEAAIAITAWKRRRAAVCEFYRQQKLRGWKPKAEAEAVLGNNAVCNNTTGGKRTRRNKRHVGRRVNAIGGKGTRRKK